MSIRFSAVESTPNFPKEELLILKKWREEKTFEKSYEASVKENRPPFTFYDGPPFATGTPHYGHILAGTIKDVITRCAHQSNKCVERRFGWDCHGLPVEYEVDKMLNVKDRRDIVQKIGISEYNETCRSIVMKYSKEWEHVTERLGRWINFENDYKTMDLSYMETVWWVFKKLYDRDLVYRAFKIMPYSTACTTPLSNFEANENYKNVSDPSIIVAFKSIDDQELDYLAWTTTPWTLPSNAGLCMHPNMLYQMIKNKGSNSRKWLLLKSRIPWLLQQLKLTEDDIEYIDKPVPGSKFKDRKYEYLYPYLAANEPWKSKAFKILIDEFVNDDSGTGIVQCAPAFGEEDYRVFIEAKILDVGDLECLIDESGKFVDSVEQFKGLYVKDADKKIKDDLKKRGLLVLNSEIVHSYPHCWRSDTPLIYKGVPSWFIRVTSLKEALIENTKSTNWVPKFIKEKRFHNWLAEARDWCVSRNRFWGTPIPLWASTDYKQIVCIGSIDELEKYSDKKITDIHRHFIDSIEIPDPRGKDYPKLRRIEEVFDCWFESGCMPYAQKHYPFNSSIKENFLARHFPADFVAEGIDQTRGWFYTLMVLSTALFNKPAFRNVIATGLILAEDNKKMSKRLKNYPDPMYILDTYGADALRLYLINSPVVKAEFLCFKEAEVKRVVREILLPWYHSYRFLMQECTRIETCSNYKFTYKPAKLTNVMDVWITQGAADLISHRNTEISSYRLYTIVPELVAFLEQLTNWYLRLNRDRFKCSNNFDEEPAFFTLFNALYIITILMAPFTPFITELIYNNLKCAFPESQQQSSVHLVNLDLIPSVELKSSKNDITVMQKVIVVGRYIRERQKIGLKTPLKKMVVILPSSEMYSSLGPEIQWYIRSELNILELELSTDRSCIKLTATPNFRALGSRIKNQMNNLIRAMKELTTEEIEALQNQKNFTIAGVDLSIDDINIKKSCLQRNDVAATIHVESIPELGILILLDCESNEEIKLMALGREVTHIIQNKRKSLGFTHKSQNKILVQPETATLRNLLNRENNQVNTYFELTDTVDYPPESILMNKSFTIGEEKFKLIILDNHTS